MARCTNCNACISQWDAGSFCAKCSEDKMTNKTEMPDVLHVLRTNTNYIGSPHQTDERDTAYIKRDTVDAAVREAAKAFEDCLQYVDVDNLTMQTKNRQWQKALAALRGLGE